MPEKQLEKNPPIVAVEKCLEKQVADVMTFLTEPHRTGHIHEEVMQMVERSLLRVAMERNNGVKSKAASYLGISRNSLQARLVRLGINKPTPKDE
ncbi:MAG: hypothetical protein K9K75_05030 [Deltaproteobacteria bacterium]|nr:hypothetical protein [Deltaproteobacteria bacterium]